MPTFAYQATDASGQASSGTIKADNRSAAIERLSVQGLFPTAVKCSEEVQAKRAPARGRVGQARVESFMRELSNLLAAGVPLGRALQVVSRETTHPAARAQWEAVHDDVVGGLPLADALARWPRSFPPVYTAMVRAGETGGFLDLVLRQIAELQSRARDLRGRIASALIYPAALAFIASGVLVFLLTYFIPRFSAIFNDFGGQLPALTRAIVGVSDTVVHYGWLLGLAAVVAVAGLRRAVRSESGRRRLEQAVLAAPAIGAVSARFALVRFCRMLGTLLAAGVPLISALRVARAAIGNQILADAVGRAVDQVREGASLAGSLRACERLFPESVIEMIAVAEESARLHEELVRMADVYEEDLDRKLRTLVALVEPAMLFIMATLVGTVVIGMLLPVFELQDLIR